MSFEFITMFILISVTTNFVPRILSHLLEFYSEFKRNHSPIDNAHFVTEQNIKGVLGSFITYSSSIKAPW